MKFLVGIDEAGRGPLAGPVAVGVAVVPKGFGWNQIPGVGDSKKITAKNREAIFRRTKALKKQGLLDFSVVLVSAKVIDEKGIVFAIKQAMRKSLNKLDLNETACQVLLDGSLKAPEEFKNQQTITKGDSKEKIIGLASIMAKVTRDHYMEKISLKPEYSDYQFELHKGYGTKLHCQAIRKHGLSNLHRVTYCKNLLL